jgi:flagellar motor switch protein FliM
VRKLEFAITATESNPQLVQIVPPNEVVIVIGLELRMNSRAGTMNMCIPYNVIEPLMEELSNQSWFSASRNQRQPDIERQISRNLNRAGVELAVVLAETTITLHDLLVMVPGDIISTERSATSPAVVSVEGETKFLAEVGQYKQSRAIRIVRSVGGLDRV